MAIHSLASQAWTVYTDTDGDGISDAWETANGFSPTDPADAGKDADGDAATNRDEFVAGTDPQSATSVLRAESTLLADGTIRLSLPVVAGKTYRVEMSSSLSPDSWELLTVLPAQPATATITLDDPNAAGVKRKFYRAVTPAP